MSRYDSYAELFHIPKDESILQSAIQVLLAINLINVLLAFPVRPTQVTGQPGVHWTGQQHPKA